MAGRVRVVPAVPSVSSSSLMCSDLNLCVHTQQLRGVRGARSCQCAAWTMPWRAVMGAHPCSPALGLLVDAVPPGVAVDRKRDPGLLPAGGSLEFVWGSPVAVHSALARGAWRLGLPAILPPRPLALQVCSAGGVLFLCATRFCSCAFCGRCRPRRGVSRSCAVRAVSRVYSCLLKTLNCILHYSIKFNSFMKK